jgi:hypothetical protein
VLAAEGAEPPEREESTREAEEGAEVCLRQQGCFRYKREELSAQNMCHNLSFASVKRL